MKEENLHGTGELGDSNMQNLTGKRFGKLTAIQRIGDTDEWLCSCPCGEQVTVTEAKLMSGVCTNCGCSSSRAIDLTNKVFGYLTVLEPVQKRAQDGSIRWLCRCECGEYITVSSNKLRMGHTRSCGCKSFSMSNAAKTYIDGTCVEILFSEKLRTNNTSGHTGVARKRKKWQAYMTYGGTMRSLGVFPTKEEAIEAREKAETSVRAHLDLLLNGEGW